MRVSIAVPLVLVVGGVLLWYFVLRPKAAAA